MSTPWHVVVVGGGISGLTAAHALRTGANPPSVTVLEASARVGGKLQVGELGGLPVDEGAESVLARRPAAIELIKTVGLEADLVFPATTAASVWSRGALRPLPTGTVMGVPADLRSLAASGILSPRGLARVPLDHLLPRTRMGADVSIGSYVRARLGREVSERLVEPLLGGVYAGHADALSLAATVPALAAVIPGERSLLRAADEVRRAGARTAGSVSPPARPDDPDQARQTYVGSGSRPLGAVQSGGADSRVWAGAADPERPAPVFASVRGGLGRLPAAVATASGATIRTGTTVRALARTEGGWRLTVGATAAPETIAADAVVMALPAAATARLLGQLAPRAVVALRGIPYASVAVASYVYAASAFPNLPDGSGFLVPPVEGRLVKAATFLTSKWGWLGAEAGQDRVVVRASVGRHGDELTLQRDDDDLLAGAAADVAYLTGAVAEPLESRLSRWGGALPQYNVGHLDRVARARDAAEELPGLALCGAAYDGVGVAACVGGAQAAARRVLAALETARQ